MLGFSPVSQPQARSHICLGTAVGAWGASWKHKMAWGEGNFAWGLLGVRLHLHLLSEDGQCLGTCDL